MPTSPLESILWREFSTAEAKGYIDIASPLLQELVNYSTNLFARCGDSANGDENEDVACFVVFLHMIEFTDGIEILVSRASGVPAIPLVRSSFEALMSLEYILESPQHYVRRSLSWLSNYIHLSIQRYEMIHPDTKEGIQFYKNLDREDWIDIDIRGKPFDDAKRETEKIIKECTALLQTPQFEEIESELKGNERTPWYGLFDGPKNLHDLALHLGRVGQYDFIYRRWASVAHVTDFSRFANISMEGEQYVHRLRRPNSIKDVMDYAPAFLLNAIRLMTAKFRPGEIDSQRRWYMAEVQERFKYIMNLD